MSAVKLDDARRVISAAENKAKEIGQPMNIVVGAIGVSGGNGDQDHAVATAGAAAF
jgi:uncharacterized protein GlcG (DUF336 family)